MDAADLELFGQTLQQVNESSSGAALDAALVDLGWHDALVADRHAAVALQFEHQGRAGSTSSALEHLVAHALGIDEPVAVVLPALGTWAPPGRVDGDLVVVDGLATVGFAERARVLIVASTAEGPVALTPATGTFIADPRDGVDPDLGLARMTGGAAAGGAFARSSPATWEATVDVARLALAHELIGASRTMLDQARTHALERVQFGRPIAQFQAVRHRLAEAFVAIEAAEAMVDAAWIEGTPAAIAMAKALAGRGARTVANHSQQVLAGIGFTTEHPFHLFFRRVLVLDQLFGSARTLTAALGREVIEQRSLPPLLPL